MKLSYWILRWKYLIPLSSSSSSESMTWSKKTIKNRQHATTSSMCLLLRDTNTRRVLRSDLDDNCVAKTITHANIDLLRSWITEKLRNVPSESVILGGGARYYRWVISWINSWSPRLPNQVSQREKQWNENSCMSDCASARASGYSDQNEILQWAATWVGR